MKEAKQKEEKRDVLSTSVIASGARIFLRPRELGYEHRPVFIDGPCVGNSYDPTYSIEAHVEVRNRYFKRKANELRGESYVTEMCRFPVKVLTKLLFYFISRGHRTVAFLPVVYNERSCNGEIVYDMSDLVSDVQELRILVSLGLVEFIRDEKTFLSVLWTRTESENGVLITTNTQFVEDFFKSANQRMEAAENFKNIAVCSSGKSQKDDEEIDFAQVPDDVRDCGYWKSAGNVQQKKTPIQSILIPIFYASLDCRGFAICPLQLSPEKFSSLTVEETLISRVNLNDLENKNANRQLTISEQFRLLKQLAGLLSSNYYGAPPFDKVLMAVEGLMQSLGVVNIDGDEGAPSYADTKPSENVSAILLETSDK